MRFFSKIFVKSIIIRDRLNLDRDKLKSVTTLVAVIELCFIDDITSEML